MLFARVDTACSRVIIISSLRVLEQIFRLIPKDLQTINIIVELVSYLI